MNQLSLIKSPNKDLYQLLLDDNAVLNLLPIPQGSFLRQDKKTVAVDAFYMAQFPVTQELYQAVMVFRESTKGKSIPLVCKPIQENHFMYYKNK
jgi:hypothetical protein